MKWTDIGNEFVHQDVSLVTERHVNAPDGLGFSKRCSIDSSKAPIIVIKGHRLGDLQDRTSANY